MKKMLFLLFAFIAFSGILVAQQATTQGTNAGNIYIDEEEIVIDVKAFAPNQVSTRLRAKPIPSAKSTALCWMTRL
jgi:hypothetical protein